MLPSDAESSVTTKVSQERLCCPQGLRYGGWAIIGQGRPDGAVKQAVQSLPGLGRLGSPSQRQIKGLDDFLGGELITHGGAVAACSLRRKRSYAQHAPVGDMNVVA